MISHIGSDNNIHVQSINTQDPQFALRGEH